MRIILSLITVLFINIVRGQNLDDISGAGQVVAGIRVGSNFNQFTRPGTFIGFNGGAFVKYSLTNFLDAKVEILYAQQGGKLPDYNDVFSEVLVTNPNVNQIIRIDPYINFGNIEIPVLVDIAPGPDKGSTIEPRITFGGSYGFSASTFEHHTTEYVFDDGTIVRGAYQKENAGNDYRQNQWSLIGGLGFNYNIGRQTFFMDIRYRQGLTQLNRFRLSRPERGGDLYSSTLSINFGMTIFNLLNQL